MPQEPEKTNFIIDQSLKLFEPATLRRLFANLPPHSFNDNACRKAAVYAILDHSKRLLIIQKPCYNKGYPWSGQLAFPGGHVDTGDAGLLETAFREVREEVGIAPEQLSTVGTLGRFPTVHNVSIEAFLGFTAENVRLQPQTGEVERILWVGLTELMQTHLDNRYFERGVTVADLLYPVENLNIWGATARIIQFLLNAALKSQNLYDRKVFGKSRA